MKLIRGEPDDQHYRTIVLEDLFVPLPALHGFHRAVLPVFEKFYSADANGMVFGTIALKSYGSPGFTTTARGKNELADLTYVRKVDHDLRIVIAGPKKATLNAPLLDRIFATHPGVKLIVHYHQIDSRFPVLPFAEPGTIADTNRDIVSNIPGGHVMNSFNIADHGVFRLFGLYPTPEEL